MRPRAQRPAPRRVTISDVADAAGVSRTTVSLVLADHPRITGRTKDHVRATMAELGYVYNRAATAVRSGSSGLLGVLVTDIRNPFFAELTMSIDQAVETADTNAILGFSFGSPHREAEIAMSLTEHRVGGLILLPTPDSALPELRFLTSASAPPLVQLLREVPGLESDYVGVDNHASGRLLGQHLRAKAVRSVAFVGGPRGSRQFDDRLAGLRDGLAGATVTPVIGGPASLGAVLAVEAPDAVVTYNDTTLLSAIHQLHAHGREPGRDVALASFDNTPISAELDPAVTSIDHHAADLARLAIDLLRERTDRPEAPWRRELLPGTLIERPSTHL